MGNSADGTGYACSLPAMVNSWRQVWRAPKDALFSIATLAAGGSEGAGQHMAVMRWSQTANCGYCPNPALPNSFGAQVYDLSDPWASKYLDDGNERVTNKTTGKPLEPESLACCMAGDTRLNSSGEPGCGNKTASDPRLRSPCIDKFNCALPDPATGKYCGIRLLAAVTTASCAAGSDQRSEWSPRCELHGGYSS